MRSDATSEAAVQVALTSELDAWTLRAVRALLDEVFGAEMSDHAWHHALGGVHALVWEKHTLVGHGSVVPRRLEHAGRVLRAGYIEGVAVRTDRRGRGYGAAVLAALEQVVRHAYDIGALGASEMGAGFYRHRGWKPWRGRTWALTASGIMRTEEDDEDVHVLEVGLPLDLSGDLTCDWREGDIW